MRNGNGRKPGSRRRGRFVRFDVPPSPQRTPPDPPAPASRPGVDNIPYEVFPDRTPAGRERAPARDFSTDDDFADLCLYLLHVWGVDDPGNQINKYGIEVVRKVVHIWQPWTAKNRPRDRWGKPSGIMIRKIQEMAALLAQGLEDKYFPPPDRINNDDGNRDRHVEEYRRRRGRLPWESTPEGSDEPER